MLFNSTIGLIWWGLLLRTAGDLLRDAGRGAGAGGGGRRRQRTENALSPPWVPGLQIYTTMPGLFSAGDGTQGFMHARQILYQLNEKPQTKKILLYVGACGVTFEHFLHCVLWGEVPVHHCRLCLGALEMELSLGNESLYPESFHHLCHYFR